MNWFLFGLALTGISILVTFIVIDWKWKKSYEEIWDVIRKIAKQQEYDSRLFHDHFDVVDKTIIEEREQKHFWQERALRAEKKYKKKSVT